MKLVIAKLLKSRDPSIRYKTLVNVLGENPDSSKIKRLQKDIKTGIRAGTLLSRINAHGLLEPINQPYQKWTGAHWVLPSLADIGYPKNDKKLFPIINQVLECWSHPFFFNEQETDIQEYSKLNKKRGVPKINGKYRRCASQQANAVYSSLMLGSTSEVIHDLVKLLLKWQWPDGGWNCDLKYDASCSSFFEGWPAEGKYYRVLTNQKIRPSSNVDLVDWGGVDKRKMNEWVTVDALYVLVKAKRVDIQGGPAIIQLFSSSFLLLP